jgi:hypothetical protein
LVAHTNPRFRQKAQSFRSGSPRAFGIPSKPADITLTKAPVAAFSGCKLVNINP